VCRPANRLQCCRESVYHTERWRSDAWSLRCCAAWGLSKVEDVADPARYQQQQQPIKSLCMASRRRQRGIGRPQRRIRVNYAEATSICSPVYQMLKTKQPRAHRAPTVFYCLSACAIYCTRQTPFLDLQFCIIFLSVTPRPSGGGGETRVLLPLLLYTKVNESSSSFNFRTRAIRD